MEIGRCPRCLTPYSASEIIGYGILRARSASLGGPRMEYTCQSCGRLIHLIPHGEGRYAPPGVPPPEAVPLEDRRPPWVSAEPADGAEEPPAEPPEPARERVAPPAAEAAPDFDPEGPMDALEALALLGVSAAASQGAIERAFKARSRTCHPDKVAHLDPEFQDLAERKFKRLQQAYNLLLD